MHFGYWSCKYCDRTLDKFALVLPPRLFTTSFFLLFKVKSEKHIICEENSSFCAKGCLIFDLLMYLILGWTNESAIKTHILPQGPKFESCTIFLNGPGYFYYREVPTAYLNTLYVLDLVLSSL